VLNTPPLVGYKAAMSIDQPIFSQTQAVKRWLFDNPPMFGGEARDIRSSKHMADVFERRLRATNGNAIVIIASYDL
jgi:hypothetical protein